MYYYAANSNPGYLRIKEAHKESFNHNMNVIETQFRNGDISYLEYKPNEEEQTDKSQSHKSDRPRHTRKQSALTKDVLK